MNSLDVAIRQLWLARAIYFVLVVGTASLATAVAPVAAPRLRVLAAVSVNALRDLSLATGQPLTVALPPEALRVFPVSQ